MHTKLSPHQRARLFLESLLESEAYPSGSRLPPLHQLSLDSHIATVHLCKALRLLRAQKKVSVFRKKGIFSGSVSPERAANPGGQKWQRIRLQLQRDLLNNEFQGPQIPPIRQLAIRYSVSLPLMQRVIKELVNDRVLYQNKRAYVYRIHHTRSFSSMMLLSPGFPTGIVANVTPRLTSIVMTLESECARRGIRLSQKGITAGDTAGALLSPRDIDSHMGFIFWSHGVAPEVLNETIVKISRRRKPVAVIDELGTYALPPDTERRNLCKIFAVAGHAAGRQVARYLLGLGHRSLCYFALEHHWFWSRQRLLGLTAELQAAGIDTPPRAYTLDSVDIAIEPPELKGYLSRIRSDMSRYTELARPMLAAYATSVASEIIGKSNHLDRLIAYRISVEPLVRSALEHAATAWVVAADIVTLAMLPVLQRIGIAIPRDLSLVSFDNTSETYQYGITSYDFMFESIARMAFSFIVHPSSYLFRGAAERIECEGAVIARNSTAPRKTKAAKP